MTWQAVILIAFIPITIYVILAWHSWVYHCDAKKHISDNQLRIAQIPRSLFGSGIPFTPAAMHHSGGVRAHSLHSAHFQPTRTEDEEAADA